MQQTADEYRLKARGLAANGNNSMAAELMHDADYHERAAKKLLGLELRHHSIPYEGMLNERKENLYEKFRKRLKNVRVAR